jgi:hypothetical protein
MVLKRLWECILKEPQVVTGEAPDTEENLGNLSLRIYECVGMSQNGILQ